MSEKISKFNTKEKIGIAVLLLLLIAVTLLTRYYGSTDIGDYSDIAKYFGEKLASDIRGSHSYLYGFINAPFVSLAGSFIGFKIISLLSLILIIYSVYIITGRDKRALWLILLSPVVWYMAPWINPIQLSSLLFLWAYHFMKEYSDTNKIGFLACSGILIGLSWAFWDTVLFFAAFLLISFMYDKELSHFFYALIFILIGLAPRLLLDAYLFNFPTYTMLKSTMGTLANIFGGIYGKAALERATEYSSSGLIAILPILLSIPLFYWRLYKPSIFNKDKKTMIFLSLSLLLILINPQTRYTLIVVPIIILLLVNNLNKNQFKLQLTVFAVISILFFLPYMIQMNYSLSNSPQGVDFSQIIVNPSTINISTSFSADNLARDIMELAADYPNNIFIVGDQPDYSQMLAHWYWGFRIEEFVSIQDYEMWLNNRTILFEKTLMPVPRIDDRRQIWISGGMSVNENDATNYSAINYALGIGAPINITGFQNIKNYTLLYLSEKTIE